MLVKDRIGPQDPHWGLIEFPWWLAGIPRGGHYEIQGGAPFNAEAFKNWQWLANLINYAYWLTHGFTWPEPPYTYATFFDWIRDLRGIPQNEIDAGVWWLTPQYKEGGLYTVSLQVRDGNGQVVLSKAASIDVAHIERLEVDCLEAEQTPVSFPGAVTDMTKPCDGGTALTLWRDQVLGDIPDITKYHIISCKAVLSPAAAPDRWGWNSLCAWSQISGHETLPFTPSTALGVALVPAPYGDPFPPWGFGGRRYGGVYVIENNLMGIKTRCQVHMPVAGADMTFQFWMEVSRFWAWSGPFVAKCKSYCLVPGDVWKTQKNLFDLWCAISGSYFDQDWDPVDRDELSPCKMVRAIEDDMHKKHPLGGHYNYLTINGEVIHGHNLNNALWAMLASQWGYPLTAAQIGMGINQVVQKINGESDSAIPTAAKVNAISLGYAVAKHFRGGGTTLKAQQTFFTDIKLRTLWDQNEEHIWPSPYFADNQKSTISSCRPVLDQMLTKAFGDW